MHCNVYLTATPLLRSLYSGPIKCSVSHFFCLKNRFNTLTPWPVGDRINEAPLCTPRPSHNKTRDLIVCTLVGPCVGVTCSWNSWGSWSSTCGKMTRQRTSKATQSIINRPNCNGLQSTCPKPDVQSLYVSCK